jgi:hypothetical protein
MSHQISISPGQRDLLYDRIMAHLSGIDAVWMAARHEDFEKADRFAHEFCDELHLIMNDLGWGGHSDAELVVLTSPPEVVRRVMRRLRATAATERVEERQERIELSELEEKNRQIREACDQVLAALSEAEASEKTDHQKSGS